HGPHAGSGRAEHHVYGTDFALRLDKRGTGLGEFAGKVLRDITLGGYGVAEIAAHASLDGRHGNSLVPLDELSAAHFCCSLKTVMATSGHISAQRAQPVHFSAPENRATV